MDKITKKIRDFLTSQGFEFGVFGVCQHKAGIGYACAYVKPKYSPRDGSYTITVDPTMVKGWTCSPPYNYTTWWQLWEKSYTSPEELVSILNEKISPPVGCWADYNPNPS